HMHRRPGNDYAYRLPWIEVDRVVEWEPDQHLLTDRTTAAALAFVEQHREQPFFCYVPFSMPHIPIYASEAFAGRSPRGLYGDVIEEIDDAVGRLVGAIDRAGLREQTLFVFASDNGPWLPFKEKGGSAGLLRGGKGTNWEGGQRVPCIARWPGTIPSGSVCRQVATTMDLLPTIAKLVGDDLSELPPIDGHDIGALLRGEPDAASPSEHFVYYTSKGELAGVRRGPWKLLLGQGLFDIERDVSEQWDRSEAQPELVAELTELAHRLDAAIAAGMRPVRTVEERLFDPGR
ncbi:MAG: sulfatase-like hydrolase/transferase, partial [Planctomycetes bacterium]|nr:sulfatase-like hydrolase/transferase [Planctomycetota bacterium]